MGAALKINATTPVSVKEMSGTDYDYVTYTILSDFASADTGVGTVSVNPASTTGLTSIGAFTDTYRPYANGTHPIGTDVTSAVYTFYQDLQSAAENLTRPIEYSSGVKEQTDTNLNADSISVATANLVANGVGVYALQASSPSGGTWTSKATIGDIVYPSTTSNFYLWRKTATTAPGTTIRPLKINSTSPISVKEMSDAEIKTLTPRLRNQIVSTGKGKYAVQSSAPTPGTWITQGTILSDTRGTTTSVNYTGNYSGAYTGYYTGTYSQNFSGTYTTNYTGSYTGNFSGNYTGAYSRAFSGVYTLYYAGFVGGNFTGYYTGTFSGAYTGTYSQNFSGTYTGSFSGSYTGNFSGAYTGSYTGTYTGSYAGLTANSVTETASSVYLWLRTA